MKRNFWYAILLVFVFTLSHPAFSSPLHEAAYKGDIEAAKNWLKTASKTINDKDSKGMTPLDYAVEFSTVEMVKFLLDNGADVNAKDAKGKAPIHYVMWSKTPDRVEKAKALLDHNADINMRSEHHQFTPIFYAIMYSQKNLVQFCIDNGADLTIKMNMDMNPVEYARKYGRSKEILKLLESRSSK
ncbi:MAG: ankyrin repeat domain-containing protein [Firmicutes bacterium]|nr:ankyrin repeat domain-containing protein [Bacillota bacterium]